MIMTKLKSSMIPVVVCALLAIACSGGAESVTPDPGASTTSVNSVGSEQPTTSNDGGVPDREDEPEVEESACPAGVLDDVTEPVTVTMWHAMTAVNQQVIEQLVDEYNASQQNVRIDVSFQGVYTEAFEKYLNTLRSGGDLPDIVQLNETMLQQMVDSQSIIPIQACIDADRYDTSDFAGALLDQYRIGNVVVTMPFQLSNPVLYYDGADFEAIGLDPADPPETFDEVLEVSRRLQAAGVVEAGLAVEVDSWIIEQWFSMAGSPLVDNDNGRSARATAALLDSATGAEIYEFLATMRDEGLIVNTGRGTDQAAIGKYLAVAFNDAAMTIGTSANLGEIYLQLGEFPDLDLQVGRLPGPTGGGVAVGGGSLYLTSETSDQVRGAAWDFMKWLNESEQQIAWSNATGYIPTVQSAISDPDLEALWTDRPGYRVAFDQLSTAGPIPGGGGPVIGDFLGVREAIEQSLEALYAGADAETAQAQALAEANDAIAEYNRRIGE